MHRFTRALRLLGAIGLLAGGLSLPRPAPPRKATLTSSRRRSTPWPGVFLDYWQSHGGLAQQGYPHLRRDAGKDAT